MLACGWGFVVFQAPNNRAMIASAPRHRSGGASGMLCPAPLLGQPLGAALVALLFGRIGVHATVYALFIAAGFAITAAAVSSLRLFQKPPVPAAAKPVSALASEETIMP